MKSNKLVTALNAVTATTTSEAIDVQYAEKITLLLTRANHSAGSHAFSVTGSIDGTTYVTLNMIVDNVTNTNAQNYTRVASKTLSADGSALVGIDLEMIGLKWIKVTATETTDGVATVKVFIEY
jgi:hypothetical protein